MHWTLRHKKRGVQRYQGFAPVIQTVDNFACGQAAGWAFDADNVNHVRVHVIACAEGDNGLINPLMGWRVVTR